MPIIMSIRNLKVNMPREAVKGVDLDIREGEILGIAGLSGCGKLGIANGIRGLFETEGDVKYRGKPLNIQNTTEVLKQHIAFISEDRKKVGLVLDESVMSNCVMSAYTLHGRFEKKRAGISFLDRKAGTLSGGNQQKVCLASMLLQEPEFAFISEPSRGIDVGAKQLILDHLKKLNREKNVTMVIASSELNELRSVCDRIAVVSDGKVTGILKPEASSEEFGMLIAGLTVEEHAGKGD